MTCTTSHVAFERQPGCPCKTSYIFRGPKKRQIPRHAGGPKAGPAHTGWMMLMMSTVSVFAAFLFSGIIRLNKYFNFESTQWQNAEQGCIASIPEAFRDGAWQEETEHCFLLSRQSETKQNSPDKPRGRVGADLFLPFVLSDSSTAPPCLICFKTSDPSKPKN